MYLFYQLYESRKSKSSFTYLFDNTLNIWQVLQVLYMRHAFDPDYTIKFGLCFVLNVRIAHEAQKKSMDICGSSTRPSFQTNSANVTNFN